MSTIIERRVYLEPRYLDQNIMHHLLARIIENTFGECSKEYGHILSVERIVKIVSNEDTVFTVQFEAKIFKPEAGKKLRGVVCKVYKDGIFIDIVNKQKMLVPAVILKEKAYSFDEAGGIYTNGNAKIKEGNEVDAVITAAKYNKQYFSCIGSLV